MPGAARFETGLAGLSERARARLVIENDDRTFSLRSVLEAKGKDLALLRLRRQLAARGLDVEARQTASA